MAAAAFYRSIHAFIINPLMAILAKFMRSLFIAVDISVANVFGVAGLAIGAGICFLMLSMREICRLPGLCGLQDNFRRTYAYLHSKNTTSDNE
ncbi:MAG: hypothetical protein AMJ61_02875 [Desulfobacterales bacterium SG8_35_2]|nr:MAG: hypothetical protein AMJ61_02875 [Desulfobacterales bacterium SG8_35_2]